MNYKVRFEDLKLIDYQKAWDYQEELLKRNIEQKIAGRDTQGTLIFCEHPHVFTLGKSGHESNLLINSSFLEKIQASFVRTNRGGDITYHGPGQIVGYPIFDLESLHLTVKGYVRLLEDAIIRTLGHYGIDSDRIDGATGVWLAPNGEIPQRKICAIGVKVSRYVTMHGFAFNVNTNLDYFNHIHPCGFVDKGVTALNKELGRDLNFEEVKDFLKKEIGTVFQIDFV
jgi:lipoyl(octanoyl) transferase